MTTQTNSTSKAERHEQLCSEAMQNNGGGRHFSLWKEAALGEVVELANRAERMDLLHIDLSGDMDVIYRIRMPVPQWPRGGKLVVGDFADFHLVYRDDWREVPPPGWAPLGVFMPRDIFHPNSRPSLRGALCLGELAPSTSPRELVLKGYFLASLQDYTLDERDPHGVLNPQACEYFRCHDEYLPLTAAGLFDPWIPDEDAR